MPLPQPVSILQQGEIAPLLPFTYGGLLLLRLFFVLLPSVIPQPLSGAFIPLLFPLVVVSLRLTSLP